MTHTDLPLRCQLGDCSNRAALTVTIDLPVDWSESREYNAVTLQVAVCGDCAPRLESLGQELLKARVRCARQQETEGHAGRLAAELVALIEAVDPPYEPVHGSIFATWLAKLDKSLAQSAWRLLAHVKRQATARRVRIDGVRFQHRGLVPPMDPLPPGRAVPPSDRRPRGGDDAA